LFFFVVVVLFGGFFWIFVFVFFLEFIIAYDMVSLICIAMSHSFSRSVSEGKVSVCRLPTGHILWNL